MADDDGPVASEREFGADMACQAWRIAEDDANTASGEDDGALAETTLDIAGKVCAALRTALLVLARALNMAAGSPFSSLQTQRFVKAYICFFLFLVSEKGSHSRHFLDRKPWLVVSKCCLPR